MALITKKMLLVVVDSGTTNNFIEPALAKKLNCKLEAITPLKVPVVGGMVIDAPYTCRRFSWQLQQPKFTSDVMVLPLRCGDLVLAPPRELAQQIEKLLLEVQRFSASIFSTLLKFTDIGDKELVDNVETFIIQD